MRTTPRLNNKRFSELGISPLHKRFTTYLRWSVCVFTQHTLYICTHTHAHTHYTQVTYSITQTGTQAYSLHIMNTDTHPSNYLLVYFCKQIIQFNTFIEIYSYQFHVLHSLKQYIAQYTVKCMTPTYFSYAIMTCMTVFAYWKTGSSHKSG